MWTTVSSRLARLMCEQFILEKTGLTTADHQRLSIERYDTLLACDTGVYIFGVKLTALKNAVVRKLAWSSDGMAWSFAARYGGRNANDWKEAKAFIEKI